MKEKYFTFAAEESEKAEEDCSNKAKVGCVAMYKGTILAKGHNMDKTHTTQAKYNIERYKEIHKYPCAIHAEIACLNKIKYLDIDFSKVIPVIYRKHKNGLPGLARPCPSCMKMIKDMGIKKIYYTGENSYIEEHLK